MKRLFSLIMTLALLLGLCACAQSGVTSVRADALTWHEQYDLGVRYLSEGNYKEAIIAFTAAIDIDPKRPEAFIGRGDAYVGTAQLAAGEDAAELPKESKTAYESAVADYLAAIGLDKLLAAVYGKAADVYLALGDTEAAKAILQQGVGATGDEGLAARLAAMDNYGNRWDSAFWSWDGSVTYDENGELSITYRATAYNAQGLPIAGEDYSGGKLNNRYTMEWNDQGQLLRMSWVNIYDGEAGESGSITLQYDAAGQVLLGDGITCEYDKQGRVIRYTEQFHGESCPIEITYDEDGRQESSTEVFFKDNGVSYGKTIFTYND